LTTQKKDDTPNSARAAGHRLEVLCLPGEQREAFADEDSLAWREEEERGRRTAGRLYRRRAAALTTQKKDDTPNSARAAGHGGSSNTPQGLGQCFQFLRLEVLCLPGEQREAFADEDSLARDKRQKWLNHLVLVPRRPGSLERLVLRCGASTPLLDLPAGSRSVFSIPPPRGLVPPRRAEGSVCR
jgi:hypothetical protein